MYDTIIIGKGPAGISAAIYLKRAGLNCLVIGKDNGTLEKADVIENYYGFSTPISGTRLVGNGIRQAKKLGIEVKTQEVVSVDGYEVYNVKTQKKEYQTKTVLFATGRKRRTASIKGIDKFTGSGVSFCAVCDGFFYKNKTVAVIGSGDYAVNEANYLKTIAKEVVIFTDGQQVTAPKLNDFKIVTEKIIEVNGETRAEKIVTSNGDYAADGFFVALGSAGAADFATKLGLEVQNGNIIVDGNFATNVPGIYAAGDCVGGFLQVAKAVSDGANAANSITKYIKSAKT